MVEFAGWEMPLKYDSADKSKVAGSPGEGPLPRAQRRFSTKAQVGFTSSCRTPPSSKVRRSFRCRTHGSVNVCALSPQAGPGCHTRSRLLTSVFLTALRARARSPSCRTCCRLRFRRCQFPVRTLTGLSDQLSAFS